jgi:glycosyltransferase involved in cell wall biosynthesis
MKRGKFNGKFSVALIHTQLPGIIMYRMANFANHMKTPVMMPDYDIKAKDCGDWQNFVMTEKSIMEDVYYLAKHADVIVFQRFLNQAGLGIIKAIRECSQGTKKIGMEIDDYMFNVPTYNHAHSNYRPGSPLWTIGLNQMELSDFMVVSTNRLKEYYSKYNDNIFVAENCIDLKWWGKDVKVKPHDKIRIGWCGANAHLQDLNVIKNVIDRIIAKYPQVEFHLYSPNRIFEDKPGLVNEIGFVSLDKYPKKLKSMGFDIGLAPLCDNMFNRSKSANRWLEYSMMGIPTVASDIGGQFSEIGEKGVLLLASNEEEWFVELSSLIESEDKRKQLGKKALEYVLANYTAEEGAKRYDALVKSAFKVRGKNELQRTGVVSGSALAAGAVN